MSLYDPRNRKELFLRGVLDGDGDSLPNPQNREEIFLKAIAQHTADYYGAPLTASTVAGMTDQSRVYVYTGSEAGFTAGNWYYWDGAAWTSGGVYNSIAIQTDKSLSVSDMAADAAVTGEDIGYLNGASLSTNLIGMEQGVLYEIYPPIKSGEKFTFGSVDGTAIGRYVDFKWYDESKTQLGSARLYATDVTQTKTVTGGDLHYFEMVHKPIKFVKLVKGTSIGSFSPYFRPYSIYAPGNVNADDYYKQRVSYPFTFVGNFPITYANGQLGQASAYYKSTPPIWLHSGDVLHYNLCPGTSTYAGIALFNASGTFISAYAQGTGNGYMVEGSVTLSQDCYVIATHRFYNVQSESPYFYVNDSIFRTADISVTVPDALANTALSGYGDLDGWENHAEAFSKLMLDVEDTEGFMFFTDSHFMAKTGNSWQPYMQQIMSYIEKLYYSSPCSFILHGGDWLGSGEARADYLPKLSAINGYFRRNIDKFALLVGNHETGNQSSEHTVFTPDTLANTLLANVGKTYYKFNANTFTMYCFDSWHAGSLDTYTASQIDWFGKSLESEKSKHIVIAVHMIYNSGSLTGFGDELTKCADAYNNRSSYTYNSITYNFSSATGKIAFAIAGHEHGDSTGTVNNIPYILTTNLTGYDNTSFTNLPLPLDLMRINWKTGKLTAYRASRGTTGTTRNLNIIT